jgi:hypothetical protein
MVLPPLMVGGCATSEVKNMVINDHVKNLRFSKLPLKWYKYPKKQKWGPYHKSFMVVKLKNEK